MSVVRITGAQLHAARALAGISRETLAERAGVSRYSILKWENSSHATPPAFYVHLCRAVSVLEAEGVRFTESGVQLVPAARPPISITACSEAVA
jgi:transcriptional regulator with XRE-family HTH domain